MMDEVDVAVGRLLPFATGLGVGEFTLRLIALRVWTDGVERTAEEKVAEVRRRLMRAAGGVEGFASRVFPGRNQALIPTGVHHVGS